MTSWVDARIKCPFYKYISAKDKTVNCEAIIGGAKSNKQVFSTKSAMKRQVDGYCAEKYTECPVYKAISREVYRDEI